MSTANMCVIIALNYCQTITVRNGYSCVPVALSEGLDIRLGTAVTEITYGGPGVTVKAVNPRAPNQPQTFKGERFCYFSST